MGISKDFEFVGLTGGNIHDTDFMRVDNGGSVESTKQVGKSRYVLDPLQLRGAYEARIGRELQDEIRRVDDNFFAPLRWCGSTPDVSSNGIRMLDYLLC